MICPKCGYNDKKKKLKISQMGIELVKHFEGKHLTGYLCPANVPTIGYGHTGEVDGKPITVGMVITEEKAEELLKKDMEKFEEAVNNMVNVQLLQNQFDALVSFSFNVGSGALKNSTLLKLLNQGKYDEVPKQLLRWNKVGGKVLPGLTRRRQAEAHLWSFNELKVRF